MATQKCQSFLRWAGSKKQIVRHLASYYSKDRSRYVEPFAGSACLFFFLEPQRAVLGDLNHQLISTLRQVKYRPASVVRHLGSFKRGKREYLRLRATKPESLTPARRAARFIYLNRFCFNGLYRTNRAGLFNVPYGGGKSGQIPSAGAVRISSKVLRNAALVSGDFSKVLRRVRKGDFVYMDPPYYVKTKRVFNEYNGPVFGSADLVRLRKWMEILHEKGVSFLVSYADCAEAKVLSDGFRIHRLRVRRNIAGFSKNRGYSSELLISNVRPKDVFRE